MKNLVLLILLSLSMAAYSGNDREKESVISWLEIVDSGKYAASWDESALFFQEQISSSKWVQALNKVRSPLGGVISREVTNTSTHSTLPGVSNGEYVVVILATSYEHKKSATETVTVTKDGDEWRVVGYFIK